MNGLCITGWQRRGLARQLKQALGDRLYRRTLAVLEVSRGKRVTQVAESLGVTRQTVHNWIDRYRAAYDAAALLDGERRGRPRLWRDDHAAVLRWLLERSPDPLGYFAVNWTAPLLQDQLAHLLGLSVSEDTLRRRLQELGYVWNRGRYELDPDPELEKQTPDSPPNPPVAASQCPLGGGRNGPVALSPVAGRMEFAGPEPGRIDFRR